MITKKVSQLKKGDVLASTNLKIVREGIAYTFTPKGKLEVIVELPNLSREAKLWNKNTTVKIKDQSI